MPIALQSHRNPDNYPRLPATDSTLSGRAAAKLPNSKAEQSLVFPAGPDASTLTPIHETIAASPVIEVGFGSTDSAGPQTGLRFHPLAAPRSTDARPTGQAHLSSASDPASLADAGDRQGKTGASLRAAIIGCTVAAGH